MIGENGNQKFQLRPERGKGPVDRILRRFDFLLIAIVCSTYGLGTISDGGVVAKVSVDRATSPKHERSIEAGPPCDEDARDRYEGGRE